MTDPDAKLIRQVVNRYGMTAVLLELTRITKSFAAQRSDRWYPLYLKVRAAHNSAAMIQLRKPLTDRGGLDRAR